MDDSTPKKMLTTADIPAPFIKEAALVGHVPHQILQSEPRISYSLYIPAEHYNSDPSKYASPPKLPLLVSIHGTRRNISYIYGKLKDFADTTPCAVLAPLFAAGMEGPNEVDSYKVLRTGKENGVQYDKVLLDMLSEVGHRWPGVETERVFLIGYSGGGQFAHRFLYLHPDRLAAISVGAPGRVTHLDNSKRWPLGTADVEERFDGQVISKDLIAQVPIQLVVGREDNELYGSSEFREWLKQFHKGKPDSGLEGMTKGRLDSMIELQKMWHDLGIKSQLDVVDGAKHDVNGVIDTVLSFVGELIGKL